MKQRLARPGQWLIRRRHALTGLLVLATATPLLLQPLLQRIERKQREIPRLLMELEKKRSRAADLPQLKEQMAGLRQRSAQLSERLPDAPGTDAVLAALINGSVENGVSLRRFTPQPPNAFEFYGEQLIQVELQGEYYALARLTEHLARADPIIIWRSYRLETSGEGTTLNWHGELATHYLRPDEPAD